MSSTRCTPREAADHLAMLAVRYAPRAMPWADPASEESVLDATFRQWATALCTFSQQVVEASIERICINHPTWSPNLNELHLILKDEDRKARTEARKRSIPMNAVRCDSSGWLDFGAGLEPCPQCNPFLRSEYDAGQLHDTGPTRQARQAAWLASNAMPPPCYHAPIEAGLIVGADEGTKIAWAAYIAACEHDQTTPAAAG